MDASNKSFDQVISQEKGKGLCPFKFSGRILTKSELNQDNIA